MTIVKRALMPRSRTKSTDPCRRRAIILGDECAGIVEQFETNARQAHCAALGAEPALWDGDEGSPKWRS